MIKEPQLDAFENADDAALKKVYVHNRTPFINFARKYKLNDDEILDIYQDAIIAFRENQAQGKIDELKSSVKTYLFSIGKYMIYSHLRENKKLRLLEDKNLLDEGEQQHIDFEAAPSRLSNEQRMLKEGLQKMGGKCKLILELFYYRGMTIDEIRTTENYENNNTVKSQKSRCLKKLKSMILNSGK